MQRRAWGAVWEQRATPFLATPSGRPAAIVLDLGVEEAPARHARGDGRGRAKSQPARGLRSASATFVPCGLGRVTHPSASLCLSCQGGIGSRHPQGWWRALEEVTGTEAPGVPRPSAMSPPGPSATDALCSFGMIPKFRTFF